MLKTISSGCKFQTAFTSPTAKPDGMTCLAAFPSVTWGTTLIGTSSEQTGVSHSSQNLPIGKNPYENGYMGRKSRGSSIERKNAFYSRWTRPDIYEDFYPDSMRRKAEVYLLDLRPKITQNARKGYSKYFHRHLATVAVSRFPLRRDCSKNPLLSITLQRRPPISQCSRSFSSQKQRFLSRIDSKTMPHAHSAIIALGSNMGDRIAMIEQACKKLDEHVHIRIVKTSSLWETRPMYVEDQDDFLNGVCEVSHSYISKDA